MTITALFLWAPSLTRSRVCLLYMLPALASIVFLGSESLWTRNHILLSQIWDFHFRRLLRLAGSRWRYSTHTGHLLTFNVYTYIYRKHGQTIEENRIVHGLQQVHSMIHGNISHPWSPVVTEDDCYTFTVWCIRIESMWYLRKVFVLDHKNGICAESVCSEIIKVSGDTFFNRFWGCSTILTENLTFVWKGSGWMYLPVPGFSNFISRASTVYVVMSTYYSSDNFVTFYMS
jgi:hypothetical protein